MLISSREGLKVGLTFNSTVLTQGGIVSLVYVVRHKEQRKNCEVVLHTRHSSDPPNEFNILLTTSSSNLSFVNMNVSHPQQTTALSPFVLFKGHQRLFIDTVFKVVWLWYLSLSRSGGS